MIPLTKLQQAMGTARDVSIGATAYFVYHMFCKNELHTRGITGAVPGGIDIPGTALTQRD